MTAVERPVVRVPAGLVAATVQRESEAGRRWLSTLSERVAEACARWQCTPDGAAMHGEVALVVPVRHQRGAAVLKLSFPHPGNLGEAAALRAFAGRGAVELWEADDTGLVLLLERVESRTLAEHLAQTGDPVEEGIELAGRLSRRLAVPAPVGMRHLADTAPGWLDELEAQTRAHPGAVPRRALDQAAETIDHLGSTASADVAPTMLHGDLHFGNVLAATRETWLAIDPKGWSGSAAFDAFTVVAGRRDELRPGPGLHAAITARIRRFAGAAGVDADLALACCQARAVSSYFYQLEVEGDWFDRHFLWALVVGGDA